MAGRSTWWRRLGGLLAALVLAVLTMGPSLDALICGGEDGMSAAAAVQTVDSDHAVAVEDGHGQSPHDGDLTPCMHGHCHHGAPYVPAALSDAEEPSVLTDGHDLDRVTVVTSDRHFQLKRPPRS